ncbi:MAG: RNA polymerase sigma-70 factor [Sphingobacteriales bacterium]|nr:RNA polymerase sigma-70 factor [Sphingobacteriales bacterium]
MKNNLQYWIDAVAENDDQIAFKNLFIHYFSGVVAYATSILYDKRLAEEAASDVFLKIWTNRRTLPTINNFSYYLYTAVKHASLNYLQSKKNQPFINLEETAELFEASLPNPETSTIQHENLKQIEAAINSLPHKCRIVFRLVKEDGLKYKEAAKLLNLSVKTIEAHILLAYNRIIESLEQTLPEFLDELPQRKITKS